MLVHVHGGALSYHYMYFDRRTPAGTLTPIDQQECKTYDFDGDETKTGSARMVVYVGAM